MGRKNGGKHDRYEHTNLKKNRCITVHNVNKTISNSYMYGMIVMKYFRTSLKHLCKDAKGI